MTRCAVETLRLTTKLPYELIVVEAGEERTPLSDPSLNHILVPNGGTVNGDTNIGFNEAKGEFIVYTGNDIFTRDGWLEALLETFKARDDCGIATVAAMELRFALDPEGNRYGQPITLEGVYGPFMMFRNGWTFDAENFPSVYGDTDFVMRQYRDGFRSYRNYASTLHHFNHQTVQPTKDESDEARQRFLNRHAESGLMMFGALAGGHIV